MQKIEYIFCIHHAILSFFCPKRSQNKFYTQSNNEDSKQKRAKKYCY